MFMERKGNTFGLARSNESTMASSMIRGRVQVAAVQIPLWCLEYHDKECRLRRDRNSGLERIYKKAHYLQSIWIKVNCHSRIVAEDTLYGWRSQTRNSEAVVVISQ